MVDLEEGISHYDLCKITAKRFIKESDVVVYEYQSFASREFPDVLCFKNGDTTLYEIKVSRSDFLADSKKESRVKWRSKIGLYNSSRFQKHLEKNKNYLELRAERPELFYIEAPHLGWKRYYVCPKDLIQPGEVPDVSSSSDTVIADVKIRFALEANKATVIIILDEEV